MAAALLDARQLSKQFANRYVLREVDLELRSGEVHALVGQNGSGKSTLIKLLAGFLAPDVGEAGRQPTLMVRGTAVPLPLTTQHASRLGLAFVHQDLGVVPSATVLENLRIGNFQTRFPWGIDWRTERRRAREVLLGFGLEVDPEADVASLSEVERAMLAIARAVDNLKGHTQGVLILDEPTAYLPRDGVERVFATVRAAAQAGHAILFVSHRLEEVFAVSDRVTVLRDGRRIETVQTSSVDRRSIVRSILGFDLEELYPDVVESRGDAALTATALSGPRTGPSDLTLHAGEIVGVTGLVGAGYDEIPYLLFGARRGSGTLAINGDTFPQSTMTPRKAIGLGVAFLPADRQRTSAIPLATVRENVTIPTLGQYFVRGRLESTRELRRVSELLERFRVAPNAPDRLLATLSGGNQQKALLAKWFDTRPRVLLLHEPTFGVDVGAKQAIFALLRTAAADGTSVLIASAEYEDLAHICQRVIVFRNGRAIRELRGDAVTYERILEQCLLEDVEVNAS